MNALDEKRASHIFRNAAGHFPEDTELNRRILLDVANRRSNFVGTDRFGNAWFVQTRADGTQVWVQLRGSKIVNGGRNPSLKDINL